MRTQRPIAQKVLAAVAAGLLLAVATTVPASGQPVTEQNLVESIAKAKTPEDHAALASYYRSEARTMEAKATEHESMASKYSSLGGKVDWASHCRNLASYYRKAAGEYQKLAKLHESQAAAVKGK